MKTQIMTGILASFIALSAGMAAHADGENKLVVDDGQKRVWKFVKTDSSSTFLTNENTDALETIDFQRSQRNINIEPIETLKEPSIVKTHDERVFEQDKPVFKYEIAPDSRAYFGMPDRSELEAQDIEYKKYNNYRSATMPDGRYVEPLYTVAGAGVKTEF